MAKDIDKELDEIKRDHTSRIAQGKQIAAATVVRKCISPELADLLKRGHQTRARRDAAISN
jgi:hypothetical protein